MNLEEYGWNEFFDSRAREERDKGYLIGRVCEEQRHVYRLVTPLGEMTGEISGRMRGNTAAYGEFPAVGDWVTFTAIGEEARAVIQGVLPRKSRFSRKAAGNLTEEQVMAANFDHVLILMSLNQNFNLRRLERYIVTAWDSGGMPVIILSKSDLCDNVPDMLEKVQASAPGVEIHAISAVTGEGLEVVGQYLKPGMTAVVLGSSGVGKSTLLNALAGETLAVVNGIREDDSQGRHTTTHRQLFKLPGGGLIIDTPGIRELQLWDVESGLEAAFSDVEGIASGCRFRDCRHANEPGCAVRQAVRDGALDIKRLDSYQKLQREMVFIEGKQNEAVRLQEKKRVKSLSKMSRSFSKSR